MLQKRIITTEVYDNINPKIVIILINVWKEKGAMNIILSKNWVLKSINLKNTFQTSLISIQIFFLTFSVYSSNELLAYEYGLKT